MGTVRPSSEIRFGIIRWTYFFSSPPLTSISTVEGRYGTTEEIWNELGDTGQLKKSGTDWEIWDNRRNLAWIARYRKMEKKD